MKKAVFLPLVLAAAPVLADDNGGVYVGAKYGKFMIDVEEATDPTDGGVLLGYRFKNGMAIEFEHTKAESDVLDGNISVGTVKLTTNALYFAYRAGGAAFFKFKAGLLKEDVSGEATGQDCYYDYYGNNSYCYSSTEDAGDENDVGLSAGIGAGVNIGSVVQMEVEYTIIEQDVSFLSAGLNLRF